MKPAATITEMVSGKLQEGHAEWEEIGRALGAVLIGGVGIGLLGAAFRLSLDWVGTCYVALVEAGQNGSSLAWFWPILLGAAGAGLARFFTRAQPLAAGSGVQHVEALMRNEAPPASFWVLPIKFVGGILAIGGGLALGREGPTIQMGSILGTSLARGFRSSPTAVQEVQAALGGAGLAVAFNAPAGGALFVFEEVARSFRVRLMILTLLAVAVGVSTSRLILGDQPDFAVERLADPSAPSLAIFSLLGFLLGLLGVSYNRLLIACLEGLERLQRLPVELRAALVGALVGVLGWFAPTWVGGGERLTQAILLGGLPPLTLLAILLLRWFLGPLSYAAGTPGGIFSPLLLLGAVLGALAAWGLNFLLGPEWAVSPVALAIVGMAAFFTGVVRAPLTGVVLIAEMTASPDLLVPSLLACGAAMLAATWVRGEPIYDTLRRRMTARWADRSLGSAGAQES